MLTINSNDLNEDMIQNQYNSPFTDKLYQNNKNNSENNKQNLNIKNSIEFNPNDWSIKDFQIGRPLGNGQFGRVYLARERKSQFIVALKIIDKQKLIDSGMDGQLRCEIEIQSNLQSKYINRLFGYFYDDKRVFLILEYSSDGEIFDIMQRQENGRFSEQQAADYIYQVTLALQHCHSKNVIHRDLKPENLLLSHGVIKLTDFGWAVHAPNQKRRTYCGTPDYLAPEIVKEKAYDKSIDNWCLGILTYELCSGKTPFKSEDSDMMNKKIESVNFKYPSHFSSDLKKFISKCLRKDPDRRLQLEDVQYQPWITNNIDISKY